MPTYPGVYVQEAQSDVKTITGVPTSISAFIGRALRGPVNEPISVYTFGEYENKFGGLWSNSTMSFAVRDFFLNGGSQAIVVRLVNQARTATYMIPTNNGSKILTLVTVNPGSWGDNLSISIHCNTQNDQEGTLFNLVVTEEVANGSTEEFFYVSVDETHSRYLPKVLEQQSELVRVNITNGKYDCPDIRPKVTVNSITFSTRGFDGDDLTIQEFCTEQDLEMKKQGLWALEKVDIFNLLCIPPYSFSADIEKQLIAAAVNYCMKRRAIMIVDPPLNWTNEEIAISQFNNDIYPGITTNRSYAALYFPRLKNLNPLTDNVEEFVPCGSITGIISRLGAHHGVWKAPAGIKAGLNVVSGFTVSITDLENENLNQLGINCLRTFPEYGKVIWGARTLDGADRFSSEWKYLSVRRTALFIEESLYRGLKWVEFEQNDEHLWAQILMNVGAFMYDLFIQGAFQGQTPNVAYFVKCNRETTTQIDINEGKVNIWIGFAPLKPAEFIMIYIQLLAGKIEA